MDFSQIFNSREIATILWLLVILVFALTKPDVRNSLASLVKAASKLWVVFVASILYTSACVFLLCQLNLWSLSLLKVTILWFFGWALIALANFSSMEKKKVVQKLLLELLGLTAIVSFLTNFYTFPLILEIALIPIATFIVITPLLLREQKHDNVKMLFGRLSVLLGLSVLLINGVKAINNLSEFASSSTLYEFALPVILSLLFLPFVYALNLYSNYQQKKLLARNFSSGSKNRT